MKIAISKANQFSPFRALRKGIRILAAAVPEFTRSECPLRASALTYYTLFAIVPVFALVFGLAKGFGLDEWLKLQLLEKLANHREILNYFYEFADTTLKEARGGVIAGIGLIVLFWTTVKLLSNVEQSFNRVWKVRRGRSYFRKFTDYLALVLIAPALLIAASSATVLASNWFCNLADAADPLAGNSGCLIAARIAVLLTPYLLSWLLFAFLYGFLPNTRVRCRSALFGGIIAGSVYLLFQRGYVLLQIALARYNVIYGSFSALPLFLIWIYVSWLVVLFGLVLSKLHQNLEQEILPEEEQNLAPARRFRLQLLLVAAAADDFQTGRGPSTAGWLAERVGISLALTRKLLEPLTAARVLTIVANPDEYAEPAYQPALPLNALTAAGVLRQLAGDPLTPSSGNTPVEARLECALQALREAMAQVPEDRPLAELMQPQPDDVVPF